MNKGTEKLKRHYSAYQMRNRKQGTPCQNCGGTLRFSSGGCVRCQYGRAAAKRFDGKKFDAICAAERMREQRELDREINYLEAGEI